MKAAKEAPVNLDIKVGKVTLKLTNQQKVYWPDEKITKGDLVNYYAQIADVMLPYLKDRPQSLNRFPDGIKGFSFYQKDFDTKTIPAWLHTKKLYSTSNKANIDYLICNDKATLMYMANLGCIEINPWNSRLKKQDNPDWLVIDLDPEDIAFTEVVKAAQATKKVCDKLGIDCYCKTSGATGLHIYIPLGAKYEYQIARHFAHLIAQHVHELLPDTTSLERSPKNRQKKVYLDYLQNSKGQTLAAPYSVRPKPGVTVSTPLDWAEVNAKLSPSQFTIKNIFKRLEKKGDLWKPVLGKGADIKKALAKLEE
jgi:bifunctional non-homologous end joining protein LigD